MCLSLFMDDGVTFLLNFLERNIFDSNLGGGICQTVERCLSFRGKAKDLSVCMKIASFLVFFTTHCQL